jgi:hypothetical protein
LSNRKTVGVAARLAEFTELAIGAKVITVSGLTTTR